MHGQRHRLEKPFLAHHNGMQRIQRLIHIPFRYTSRTQWVLYISRTWEALPRPSQGYWTHPAPGTHSIEIYVTNSINPPHITNCVLTMSPLHITNYTQLTCESSKYVTNSVSHLQIAISRSRLNITNPNSVLYISRTRKESSTSHELYVSCTYRVLNKLSKYTSLSPPLITNSQWVLYISRTLYNSRVSHVNMSRTQCVMDTSQSQ